MNNLPSEKMLAAYWIPSVGIGAASPPPPVLPGPQTVCVPLTDVLDYKLNNGKPQIGVVMLFNAVFNGTPDNFEPPYFSIPKEIEKELTIQPGETESNIKKLQNQGIKVLLSVIGYTPEGKSSGMGWDGIPAHKNEDFARWVKDKVIDKYGIDGIDIDDEFSGIVNPQNFVNTVAVMDSHLPGSLISKALWQDMEYFQIKTASPVNKGKYLSDLLDFGCLMAYGWSADEMESQIERYHSEGGMAYDKLCIGVQAGTGSWMTPINTVKELAEWSIAPISSQKTVPPILGMMLFTFSQDIRQFTANPQNQVALKFPNANDHRWQKTIIETWYG